MSYLALGDSYTIGEGVESEARWPNLLRDRLEGTERPVRPPVIIAQTGWTTDELYDAMASAPLVGPCGLVTLLIGVNDQYRGRSSAEYRANLRRVLALAKRLAAGGDPLIVLSIPDWSVTPFAEGRDRSLIAREVDVFNTVNHDEARRVGAEYVDVTPSSRRAADDPRLLARDGLHPSRGMYAEWAELVARCVLTGPTRRAPPLS